MALQVVRLVALGNMSSLLVMLSVGSLIVRVVFFSYMLGLSRVASWVDGKLAQCRLRE